MYCIVYASKVFVVVIPHRCAHGLFCIFHQHTLIAHAGTPRILRCRSLLPAVFSFDPDTFIWRGAHIQIHISRHTTHGLGGIHSHARSAAHMHVQMYLWITSEFHAQL